MYMDDCLVVPDNDYAIMRKRIKQYKAVIVITFASFLAALALFICAIFLGFGCSSSTKTAKSSSASQLKFIHVSDMHLDLYYNSSTSKSSFCRSIPNTLNITPTAAPFDAPYGRVRCDSPQKLLDSTLTFMKTLSTKKHNFEFLLMTGDQVAHRLSKGFVNGTTTERVLNTMSATCKAVGQAFPDKPILPVIGNNDLPGDYSLPKDSKFYQSVLAIWKPVILCSKCQQNVTTEKELEETFLNGGYYRAEIKSTSLVLLQLNTNYWSSKCLKVNPRAEVYATADQQMKWLESQLNLTKKNGMKAILSGHIPPGIDSYGGVAFWPKNYTDKYIQLVTKTFKDVVIGQFFGHIHKDDLRLLAADDPLGKAVSFLLIAPGITPVYNNNPGFRIVSIDKDRKVVSDYEQYYMDLVLTTQTKTPVWLFDYSFGDEYLSNISKEKRAITGETIAMLGDLMINSTNQNQVWQSYIQHRQVNYQPDPFSRYALYCAVRHVTKTNYDVCVKRYPVTGG